MIGNQPLIAACGEVLWDLLDEGKQLGGAPANFAYFAKAMGADALLISRVGSDALGDETLARLERFGLRTDGITRDPEHETGKASVSFEATGSPRFQIHEPAAWDFLQVPDPILEELRTADAICFGTLGCRAPSARAAIFSMVRVTPPDAVRILDLNLRAPFYSEELIREALLIANTLKINDEELQVLSSLFDLRGSEVDRLRALENRFELKLVALTKGCGGSIVVHGEAISCHPGESVEVQDTIGAGDSFGAALVTGLLFGQPLAAVHARAAELAGYVCSQPGATPPIPAELTAGGRVLA